MCCSSRTRRSGHSSAVIEKIAESPSPAGLARRPGAGPVPQHALEPGARRFDGRPGAAVACVRLQVDPRHAPRLERVPEHQVLGLDVRPGALSRRGEPGEPVRTPVLLGRLGQARRMPLPQWLQPHARALQNRPLQRESHRSPIPVPSHVAPARTGRHGRQSCRAVAPCRAKFAPAGREAAQDGTLLHNGSSACPPPQRPEWTWDSTVNPGAL